MSPHRLLAVCSAAPIRIRKQRFRSPRRLAAFTAVFYAAVFYALVTASTVTASQPTDSAEPSVTDYAAAGEFAPAMRLALDTQSPQSRDDGLTTIAAAQAASGEFSSAVSTVAQIAGDLSRSTALESIRSAPIRSYGGPGGAALADFESLIQLITSTIEPDSWEEVGGAGRIEPFPLGVVVDARGALQKTESTDRTGELLLVAAAARRSRWTEDAARPSPLRKVSLSRLERHVALLAALGRPPTATMRVLAGLERIQYVMVFPELGDVIIAGPAGPWRIDSDGRAISIETKRPLVRLDDVVIILRGLDDPARKSLYCSINPRADRLAALKQHLDRTSGRRSANTSRKAWLNEFRELLGEQDIVIDGLDPTSPAARVLVEADYHMKLVGLGIEPSVLGVTSYLDEVAQGGGAASLDVLRWWFAVDYDSIVSSPAHDVFELRGQGVKLLSENELLNDQGERVHTGRTEPLNRRFARNFTTHYESLAEAYPIYADLQNVFDIAMVAAIIESHGLAERAGWHMTCFGHEGAYRVPQNHAPKVVDSVANYRVAGGRRIVAAVSGGVHMNPWPLVEAEAVDVDANGRLESERARGAPEVDAPLDVWWWD